ncbi:hypothetical protein IFR04_011379 [Cadophora malorum]|uniref:Uncharacterized protein n=1 Tax=Cadophora malorum TaxID=108018 RepID=A0A8H7T9B7_9HELO|nr:hypothetical protein IFR04_011379 [Cadophora malorum]
MEAMLKLYALRMREGNRGFLADRIEEVKFSNLPSKTDEHDRIARFWIEGHPCGMWPSHGYRSTHLAHDTTCQKYQALWSSDNVVQSVDDILNLDHPLGDGISCGESQVRPPWDRDQIKSMESRLNERAGLGKDGPLRLNDEFISFVKYTRGVQDPDFRKSDICGFYPRWNIDNQYYFQFDKYDSECSWQFECDMNGNRFFEKGGQRFDVLVQTEAGKTRVKCNKTERGESGRIWTSYYVFCKKVDMSVMFQAGCPQEMYTEANGWQWRVLFHDGWTDRSRCDIKLHLFDTIIEFLEWYGSWYDRLDMREVRENTEPVSHEFLFREESF